MSRRTNAEMAKDVWSIVFYHSTVIFFKNIYVSRSPLISKLFVVVLVYG